MIPAILTPCKKRRRLIGILPNKAREVYQIPEHSEAWTALAIGYKADPAKLPDALKERDLARRQRKPCDHEGSRH